MPRSRSLSVLFAVASLSLLAASASFVGGGAAQPAQAGQEPPQVEIPPENRRDLREPPARPETATVAADAERLFGAIQRDEVEPVRDFFFPRDAFLVLKGIADPGRYWDRLMGHYERDIHSLHESLPGLEGATFDHFRLVRRGGWVGIREEGNRLPYWCYRHSLIFYRDGRNGRERRFEIRTLITWGRRWYITHLV